MGKGKGKGQRPGGLLQFPESTAKLIDEIDFKRDEIIDILESKPVPDHVIELAITFFYYEGAISQMAMMLAPYCEEAVNDALTEFIRIQDMLLDYLRGDVSNVKGAIDIYHLLAESGEAWRPFGIECMGIDLYSALKALVKYTPKDFVCSTPLLKNFCPEKDAQQGEGSSGPLTAPK